MIIARNKSLAVADIHVPDAFLENPPRAAKWKRYEDQWRETGKLPKVYVDNRMNLVDGYIPYLLALHNGVKRIRGVMLYVRESGYNERPKIEEQKEVAPELPKEKPPQPYGIQLGKIHITFTKTR